MNFNKHSRLEGYHAILGASKYHWVNYDDDRLINYYTRQLASMKGTELHEFAATCIKLKQKLPRNNNTLNSYVNDAITFNMKPEQILFYSENCYGTADAISFRKGLLRVHDLKTGTLPCKIEQLEIYASLFCLEYDVRPGEIEMELRIYQNDSILIHNPLVDEIVPIMDKIIRFNNIIQHIKAEEDL